jgi:hypothetical protein
MRGVGEAVNVLDAEALAEDAAWDRRMASALSIHDSIAAEEDAAEALVWAVVDVVRVLNGLEPTPEYG